MSKAQYASIFVALTLLAVLYLGANTVPPPKQATAENGATATASHSHMADWDKWNGEAKKQVPTHAKEEIAALEKGISGETDSLEMIPLFDSLSNLWQQHSQPIATAFYRGLSAKLDKSEKKLTFAARYYLDLMNVRGLPEDKKHWAAEQAADLLHQSLEIVPENDTAQLALAVAYIEGLGEPMKGVQQLLAITRRAPNHIPANLMLGQLSVKSGQWEKAISRLETVLRQQPENKEALFFLAEAYKGSGNKEQAVKTLKRLKTLVKDPAFTADIDKYIESF